MKLFNIAAIASVTQAQKSWQRSRDEIVGGFTTVPDGYDGAFENFNVTQLMDENAEDDLFREFEDSFFHMNSPMGRNDFTEEEKALIRKFKLMKNMIVYLQRIPLFGKFCFYGCYCFAKGPKELLIDAGNGKPMDGADNACRHHLQCHSCAKLDFDDKCDVTDGYKFTAKEDEVTGIRWIQCLNQEGSCKRAICECDKALAYDLADAETEWNILHHARWGQFDAALNCERHQPGGRDGAMRQEKLSEPSGPECCGEYPRRFPFHADDGYGNIHQCCVSSDGYGRSFNPNRLDCCSNGSLKTIGSCED
jgi:hypothetical protein